MTINNIYVPLQRFPLVFQESCRLNNRQTIPYMYCAASICANISTAYGACHQSHAMTSLSIPTYLYTRPMQAICVENRRRLPWLLNGSYKLVLLRHSTTQYTYRVFRSDYFQYFSVYTLRSITLIFRKYLHIILLLV